MFSVQMFLIMEKEMVEISEGEKQKQITLLYISYINYHSVR